MKFLDYICFVRPLQNPATRLLSKILRRSFCWQWHRITSKPVKIQQWYGKILPLIVCIILACPVGVQAYRYKSHVNLDERNFQEYKHPEQKRAREQQEVLESIRDELEQIRIQQQLQGDYGHP